MKKMSCYVGLISLLVISMIVQAYSQDEMEKIDNQVFKKPAYPQAVFIHDAHNETAGVEECNMCHHVYSDGVLMEDESSEDNSCSDCHEIKPADNSLSLMKAFHGRCKTCHFEKKAGPIMCGQCHRKE